MLKDKGFKEQKKFKESLSKGQKVITIGGIHGRIVEMQETTVTIEVEGGMKLRLEKSAIASKLVTDEITIELAAIATVIGLFYYSN